jgi:23S rRNA (cytidine2498-2'-O)-methyltransferase
MDYSHLLKKLPLSFDLLIPFLKFTQELEKELLINNIKIFIQNEKFIICESLTEKPIWAQDWWPQSKLISFKNKSEAVKILKNFPNLGVYYNTINSPQSTNIRQELRELQTKRIQYSVPSSFHFKYFAWTIIAENKLLICEKPFSQFPLGWNEFNEDKETPPNRAYLKLWEILCLAHVKLNSNDVVIDLGSCPGGWSWALSQQVKKVYSVDTAPLDPKMSKIESIVFHKEDAFKLNTANYSDCTWLFSDIICTPDKLLHLIKDWMTHSQIQNFVCTIKFKGSCDFEILKQFKEIKNAKLIRLYQNKNEVTFIRQGSS